MHAHACSVMLSQCGWRWSILPACMPLDKPNAFPCTWHAQYGENLALWEPPSYWTASSAIQAWYAEGAQVGLRRCPIQQQCMDRNICSASCCGCLSAMGVTGASVDPQYNYAEPGFSDATGHFTRAYCHLAPQP